MTSLYSSTRGIFSLLAICTIVLNGCASSPPHYSQAILDQRPRSIVVIPPMNNSVEVGATYTYLSTITRPLAEHGYYVFPVAVIDQFFKENGLPTPAEMNNISLDKLRENIGADAALFVTINNWGQKFQITQSKAVVSADARLVDLRSGDLLWEGRAHAQHNPSQNQSGGLLDALVTAVADQVIGSLQDHTFELSQQANHSMIRYGRNSLLPGPYRPELIDNPAEGTRVSP